MYKNILETIQNSPFVKDIVKRSPDAEFILDDFELDEPWVEAQLPLDQIKLGKLKNLSLDDFERMDTIERWASDRGGVKTALSESPPLLLFDIQNGSLILLDGWHRLIVAKQHGIKSATALVMFVPRTSGRQRVVWRLR